MRSMVRLEKGLGIDGRRLPSVPVTASSAADDQGPGDDPSRAGPGSHDHDPVLPVALKHPPIVSPPMYVRHRVFPISN